MKLCINRLSVFAKIGEHSWEKAIKQKIFIDCQLEVTKVIDYCMICDYINEFVQDIHYDYIEQLASALCSAIKLKFSVEYCRITLEKFGCILNARSASIVVE